MYQVPFVLNIYDHLVDQLSARGYSGRSYLDIILEEENNAPKKTKRLFDEVLGQESGFYRSIHQSIRTHQQAAKEKETRSYVFIHGWGTIHPYLKASQFMGCMERFVADYKLILFYPGTCDGGRFQFLGRVDGRGPYRAQCLNDQTGFGAD